MASDRADQDGTDPDDYDEEADSDFDDRITEEGSDASSDVAQDEGESDRKSAPAPLRVEGLDSGDEATIKEQKKLKKKQKRKQDEGDVSSEDEHGGQWRAKTRSMRAHDNADKQKKSTANIKASTIDVNKIWEEMNRPGPLPQIRIEDHVEAQGTPKKQEKRVQDNDVKEGAPFSEVEETITIKRQFKFAGEVHVEEKIVPKSSAEARLWLAQQENNKKKAPVGEEASMQRPLRKISRFDPNYSNLEAFRNDSIKAQHGSFKGPKLNVVEKSKMDWAAHVDAEGLKEELDKHSKAKDAYLNRMDFLGQVGQRKEDDAKAARQKG